MLNFLSGNQSESSPLQNTLMTGLVCTIIVTVCMLFADDLVHEFNSFMKVLRSII